MGAAAARGAALAFTDADCFATPGWLAAGLKALADADVVQGAVRPPAEAPRRPWDRWLWVEGEGFYEAANLFVSRSWFERLGGFRTMHGVHGRPLGEDTVFGWSARRAGARSGFAPEALVHHEVFRRPVRDYLTERLRRRFFPELTAAVPEMRDEVYFARYFLDARSAAFDAALLALVAARRTSSWLPLLACTPYAAIATRRSMLWKKRGFQAAAVDLAADCVGLGALLYGSLRYRRVVL